MAFQLQCLISFVIVNFSLPDNTDDYANRQLFLIKYILCIGVLPSGDKICDNKNNSIGIAKSVTFSLFCCLRVGYWIHWDAIFFTQCLDLLSTAENNLKKHRPVYNNNNCFTVETCELQKCKLLSDAHCSVTQCDTP